MQLIQAGERDALHVLWAQVERFAAMKARQYITLTGCSEAELDDLYDSAYIALVYAAETYDPGRGKTFIGLFALALKSAFAEARTAAAISRLWIRSTVRAAWTHLWETMRAI